MTDEEDTGTGWPGAPTKPLPVAGSAQPHDTIQLRTRDQDAGPDADGEVRRRRRGAASRWFGGFALLGMGAAALAVVLVAANLTGLWHFSNPFATRKTDRSQPVLLLSIQDLARFEAASGNFQVVIDVQENRKFIPDALLSKRSLFVAAGSVNAFVDFSNIGTSDITTSADRKSVTVRLPAPGLEPPRLDVSKSYVYSQQEGLVNHISDLFGGDPNEMQRLYQLANMKIAAAAFDSGLAQRAADNTKEMLTQLLRSLGYTTIDIQFPST